MLPGHDEKTGRKLLERADLQDGVYYRGRCRNATVARWNGIEGCFYHWREKFNSIFIETIKHPVDDEVFDVFRPVEILANPKFEIPFDKKTAFTGTKSDLREHDAEMWAESNPERWLRL